MSIESKEQDRIDSLIELGFVLDHDSRVYKLTKGDEVLAALTEMAVEQYTFAAFNDFLHRVRRKISHLNE